MAKFKRFEIALQRLSEEHDIQRILSLNRISYFVNKMRFNSRQRLAVNYSRKFVILDHDIKAARDEAAVIPERDSLKRVTEDFDPENNDTDRRLLYQITGLRLN